MNSSSKIIIGNCRAAETRFSTLGKKNEAKMTISSPVLWYLEFIDGVFLWSCHASKVYLKGHRISHSATKFL